MKRNPQQLTRFDSDGARIVLTGLEGPAGGRRSRADMGAAARRALPFPTVGAWFGGLPVHGPIDDPIARGSARQCWTEYVDYQRELTDPFGY